MTLRELHSVSIHHQKEHSCGGLPYAYGDILTSLVSATLPIRILEVGTGLGYTAACLAMGSSNTFVETIDQDATHLAKARDYWELLGITHKIDDHEGKAEDILPTLSSVYDFIFFDGYVPQMKMLSHFERLLRKNGMLVTANLYLRDTTGGKYMKALLNTRSWQTGVFADTAISVKLQ